jgi:hypothetical protein
MKETHTYSNSNALVRGPSRTTPWPPAWLRPTETTPVDAPPPAEIMPAEPQAEPPLDAVPAVCVEPAVAQKCRRCGSRATVDTPIHQGQSIRRDCAKCGRFRSFPTWYGVAQ